MHNSVNGAALKEMVLFGAAFLAAEEQPINDLNVFPVPDGDTGTNMTLTIQTAVDAMAKDGLDSVDAVASATASALLRGARGNSGVILSLIFRGISKGLKGLDSADGAAFAAALEEGVATAYNAVMKPAEGTILTVSRLFADRAVSAAEEQSEIEYILAEAIKAGEDALAQTTEMNPVLKKAGVVDAGGKGFLVIMGGMLACLNGETKPEVERKSEQKADFGALCGEEITYTFDTVFIVRRTQSKSIEPLRAYLGSIGDCLVIGEDDEVFKVHVHTDIPGEALSEAQKYGTLELAKIENMRSQRDALAAGNQAATTDDLDRIEEELESGCDTEDEPNKPFGFLSVCSGDGLAALFRELGADGIVSGGQTMNPSTESLLYAVTRIHADTVFILPNNKNIVMAAQQCVGLTEQNIVVIPTATVPQGIAALMAAAEAEQTVEALSDAMTKAAKNVTTAQITYAARDSDFDGMAITEGDYLALLEGKLFGTNRDMAALIELLAKEAAARNPSFINIFFGADVSEETANTMSSVFSTFCPNAEVAVMNGGQPVYSYIISIE